MKQLRHPIVINADDFGMSSEVNRAVAECFAAGYISSATLMANMPAAREAIELIHRDGLDGRIGVHLNLTEGTPLTDAIRRQERFCDADGRFRGRGRTVWRLSRDEQAALLDELTAQIASIIEQGISPTHLDSHHHAHTQWPIAGIVIELARRKGINAIRPSRNCGPGLTFPKNVYKQALNRRLQRSGMAKVRYFGSGSDVMALEPFDGSVEVMVHPGWDEDKLVDLTSGRPDLEAIADYCREAGEMVSYGQAGAT